MAHVVTDHCLDCKYTYCVDACPVDAFHQGPDQLFIHPDTCIDCGACVSECPVGAIEVDLSLPDEKAHWVDKNKLAALQYPVITSSTEPLLGPRCVDKSA